MPTPTQDGYFFADEFRYVRVYPDTEKTKVELDHQIGSDGQSQNDDYTLEVPDLPHPDLTAELQKLMHQYLIVMNLPDGHADTITIVGVRLKAVDPPEVKVYAKRELPSVEKTITQATPSTGLVSDALGDVVNDVAQETIALVKGKRRQMQLFEPDENEQLPDPDSSE